MKKILTFLILALAISNTSQARTNKELIIEQDWISRQQQSQIEQDRRSREKEAIKKERERREEKQKKEGIKQPLISGDPDQCFAIKNISLFDAGSLSVKEKSDLTSPFIGTCMRSEVLTKIISKIQEYYSNQGYVTARVVVPQQNIKSGYLKLNILEGKIHKIILGDNSLGDKMEKFTAFGLLEGKILNIKDINQGITQINRLPSNDAKMKVEPDIYEGEANIVIANKKKFPARFNAGKDNLGNKFTGVQRFNFGSSFDNLLSLNDNINLSYNTNLHDNSQNKDIKNFSSSISIPLGYNIISYNYSRSDFRGTNPGINGPERLTGFSQSSNVTIDRVLFSKDNFKILGNSSLLTKSSASYLSGKKSKSSERKLTIGSIGFTASNYFKNGINLYIKPTYLRGLKILGAKKDNTNLANHVAKAQFDNFKIYTSISKKFIMPKINAPFLLSNEINAQYSKQTMFGTEQFSVGGYHSVRGFRENYITGDSGYYLRNKAKVNLASLVAPFLTKKNNEEKNGFFRKNLVHLSKVSLEPFYDFGYVKNKYAFNGLDGRLSGAGIKTIFEHKYFDASLTYGWALNKSQLITSEDKENKILYFELSAKCC